MLQIQRIINCVSAANNTKLAPFGDKKAPEQAQSNFGQVCFLTDQAFEQCAKILSSKHRNILNYMMTYGDKNLTYTYYTKLLDDEGRYYDVLTDHDFSIVKNKVRHSLEDMLYSGKNNSVYEEVDHAVEREVRSDYHNIDMLLSILRGCDETQRRRIEQLRDYESTPDLQFEDYENIVDIVGVNAELLLHIKMSLSILRTIDEKWYDMICYCYNLDGFCETYRRKKIRIVNTQLEEAKKHLAILLWGVEEENFNAN